MRNGQPPLDSMAGILDEVQAWYVGRADEEGWVYTTVLRQLLSRMYRERDYLTRRKADPPSAAGR